MKIPVNAQNDAEADGGFAYGNNNNKQGEDLTIEFRGMLLIKSYQVEIAGV